MVAAAALIQSKKQTYSLVVRNIVMYTVSCTVYCMFSLFLQISLSISIPSDWKAILIVLVMATLIYALSSVSFLLGSGLKGVRVETFWTAATDTTYYKT